MSPVVARAESSEILTGLDILHGFFSVSNVSAGTAGTSWSELVIFVPPRSSAPGCLFIMCGSLLRGTEAGFFQMEHFRSPSGSCKISYDLV